MPGRGRALHEIIQLVGLANLVAFATLAAIAVRQWWTRRSVAAGWLALSLGSLGWVVVAGLFIPEHPSGWSAVLQRTSVAMLVVFPYLLYRFTTAFGRPSHRLALSVSAMTAIVVVWAYAVPEYPASGESWPRSFVVFVVAFMLHWTVLSLVVAWRLWRAGRGQPGVARRRMWMLGYGAVAITIAIFLVAATREPDSALSLADSLFALGSAGAFLLGLAPPAALRTIWRRPEQERLQQAIESLILLARSDSEVVARVLPAMADIVGADGIALLDHEGRVLGSHKVDPKRAEELDREDGQTVEVSTPIGSVVAWTSPYAPFFGDEELQILRTLGVLTGMAVDRAQLFAAEHEARVALERIDEARASFVALAAHELRTPVAAIYGAVKTLNRPDRILPTEVEQEVRQALESQAEHMVSLVEQLLDLSRLDAEAIEIRPERFPLRERIERIAQAAAAGEGLDIEIRVPSELEGTADT